MSELANFLETPEPVDAPPETPEAEAPKVEQAVDDKPPEQEPGETGETPAPEEKPVDKTVPLVALLDEREKRQQLSNEAAELRKQLESLQKKEPASIPDPLDDHEGFMSVIDQRFSQAELNTRANISEMYARKTHADFDEKWPEIEKFVQSKPDLINDVLQNVDPYGRAFELFNEYQELQQLKDPTYKETLKAQLREEVLKELQEKQQADATETATKEKLAASLKPSLAGMRAAGANNDVPTVADPFETTFKR